MQNLLLAAFWDNLNPVKWVAYIIKGAYKGIRRFFCWVVVTCFGWADAALDSLLGFVPQPPEYMSVLLDWYGVINAWVPVDAFLWCAFSYYSFIAVIASVRFIKSWIPTLGG